jgi:hypothetical protein
VKKPKKAREWWLSTLREGTVAHVHSSRSAADACCADVRIIVRVREVLPKKPKGKR